MRRHVVAVAMIVVVAIGVAYDIHKTPATFQEGSTIVFTIPASAANPDPFSLFTGDLLYTAGLMAQVMMSPQSQDRVQQAGGLATYDLALYNLYNEEFPNYSQPYVTFTVTGATPQQVQETYAIVAAQLKQALASEQAQYGAVPHNQIAEHIIGDSGVVALRGSKKRTYAGLFMLTIIILFLVLRFLDRHTVPRMRRMAARWPVTRVRQRI